MNNKKTLNSMLNTLGEMNQVVQSAYHIGGLKQVIHISTWQKLLQILKENKPLLTLTCLLLFWGLIQGVYDAGYDLGRALYYLFN